MDITIPRCGDKVLHRPSEETWLVAWAEGNDIAPSGWPNCMARLSDCDVTYRCSDAEHAKAVDDWRSVQDDSRGRRVLRLYGGVHV